MQDRFLKRLRKKARKGMRGWPAATIALHGPDLVRASKVAVGIVPYEAAEVTEMRAWQLETGDVRADAQIAQEILEYIEAHGALSVIMTDGIIGCPHQEGIDYEARGAPSATSGRDATALPENSSTDPARKPTGNRSTTDTQIGSLRR